MSAHRLYDGQTTTDLGPATPEQVAASDAAEVKHGFGFILVDGSGGIHVGPWAPGVRCVYTAYTA